MARRYRMSTTKEPNLKDGIDYWSSKKADLDAVLGGYGFSTLPRVDALGSRQFLISLFPEFSTVPSANRPLNPRTLTKRTRAADVGAGIGRVTADVLLHLVQDVVLVEPAQNFVHEALSKARASEEGSGKWKGLRDASKSVTVLQGTLQDFDAERPVSGSNAKLLGRVGYSPSPADNDEESGFDVLWCQWCLGHLSDTALVDFLRRCRKALRSRSTGTGELDGVIVVKENTCLEQEAGKPRMVFDEADSSLTRSDLAYKKAFADAGLQLVKEELQLGFPPELYPVKMYALR